MPEVDEKAICVIQGLVKKASHLKQTTQYNGTAPPSDEARMTCENMFGIRPFALTDLLSIYLETNDGP